VSARGRRDPERVGGTIGRVLRELGHRGDTPAMRLALAWEEAVGPEVAAHAEPTALRGGVLEVRVDSPARAADLQMRQREILAALAAAVGEGAPAALRFRVG
jgi:predicted nucleic acid-binding Zn ribbon protein